MRGDRSLDLFGSPVPALTIPVRVTASPEDVRARRGTGLTLSYGTHASPFGTALVVASEHGLAGLAFVDDRHDPAHDAYDRAGALENMKARWPAARFTESEADTEAWARSAFDPAHWRAAEPIAVHLIGSLFDITVWRALLDIPVGETTTYLALARALNRPTGARAVGGAVGRNPVSMVVPCHRVLGSSGGITGYHWGVSRKRAMLAWERALVPS